MLPLPLGEGRGEGSLVAISVTVTTLATLTPSTGSGQASPSPRGRGEKNCKRGHLSSYKISAVKANPAINDGLSRESSDFAAHEDTVRVRRVARERPAKRETKRGIQTVRWRKGCGRPGFQTQAPVAAKLRFFNDVRQQRICHTFSQMRRRCSHRLDLGLLRIELFQRTTAQQLTIFPSRPERDARLTQRVNVQCMNARRRRVQRHVLQVLLQELLNLRAGQVVGLDVHLKSY